MNQHNLLFRFSSVAFMLLLRSSCSAQGDSLADCFPLSIGNQWIYHYHRSVPTEQQFSVHIDTGIASYSIIGKTDLIDSIAWNFKERRDIHRQFFTLEGPPTDSTISDSTMFNLVELKSGRHELYRRQNDATDWWYYDSSILWNSVLPFLPGMPDSSKIFRYYLLDSLGMLATTIVYEREYMIYHLTLKKDIGLQSLLVGTTAILEEGPPTADHELLNQTITAVSQHDIVSLPTTIHLGLNYPNPFNPLTRIEYDLPTRSQVSLAIYTTLGEEIARPVDRQYQIGHHTVSFEGTNLPSGIYIARLSTDKSVLARKMVLIR